MSTLSRIPQRLSATALMPDTKVKNLHVWEDHLNPKRFKPLGDGFFYQDMGTRDDDRVIIHDGKVIGRYSNSFGGFDDFKIVNPHSVLLPEYRGRGLMRRLYQQVLNEGYCFISGERHSYSANRLWQSLAKTNPWFLVKQLNPDTLKFLGQDINPKVAQRKDVRIVLLGKGWSVEKFMRKTS